MQRTYSRRALRRRSGVQSLTNDRHEPEDLPLSDPSPPRKRQKVFVEIVSPRKKKLHLEEHTQSYSPVPSSSASPAQKLTADDSKSAAERLSTGLSGSPKTPEKSSSRDLPFATPSHHSHLSSQSTRGSIVKRMLGRSRTESSLEATPKASPVASNENEASAETSTQPSPKSLPTRNIRTYTGTSRSFLVALPVPDAPLNTVEDDTEPHESYSDLRARWGIDMPEDEPQLYQDEQPAVPTPLRRNPSEHCQLSLPAGMMNDLKSITELRSKGESRRFLDEVGYLFEGLNDSSAISLRRASAFEVVSKLCDLDFNRRAKTSDFYIRTWDKFKVARAGTNDKIFDATIAFFAFLSARDPRILLEVAQRQEFISTLVEILNSFDHRKDVLAAVLAGSSDDDLKSFGILRTDLTAYLNLMDYSPSARFFVSSSLSTLPPYLLADHYLPTLLSNLQTELKLLEPRITAYESGLPLIPSATVDSSGTPSLFHIEACLRLLDSYLLGQWSSVDPAGSESPNGLSHIGGFPSELILLCIVSSNLLTESEGKADIALEVPYALPFVGMTVMRSQGQMDRIAEYGASKYFSGGLRSPLSCSRIGHELGHAEPQSCGPFQNEM
ncbi:hypothetical protein JVU11DRAFT_7881 [Chiua virens]|nr:hypothetical protein JVU11DRAFT_7881 [Chiua virens]